MITITVDVLTPERYNVSDRWFKVDTQQVRESAEATALVRSAIDLAEERRDEGLRIRVTGGPSAASCRQHPLAPGTAGDPRR